MTERASFSGKRGDAPPGNERSAVHCDVVGLSSLDKNKYHDLVQHKKSILSTAHCPEPINELIESITTDNLSPTDRKVNAFGEIEVGKLRQRQRHLSTSEIDLLIAAYKSGKSTYELAAQFGCDRTTVSNTLKRQGVTVTNAKAQNKLDIADVISMYGCFNTSQDIAEKYGVSPLAVVRCLRSQGVAIRGRWDY